MKAIILTNVSLSEKDKELLKNTDVFKIAINQHADELKPDLRICSDYVAGNLLQRFEQKVVSIREYIPDEKVIYRPEIRYKGSTLVSAVEYLISEGYDEILIVGDNTVHSDVFKNRVKKEIGYIEDYVNLYQFSNGNFNLRVQEIKDFIKE